jgi:SPP1 family predicted phage head-tail adaptor
VDGADTRAEVKGISGRELVAAGAETAEATIRVWMRYRHDVSAASRIKVMTGPFKGNTLNVVGPPIPDAKGFCLRFSATGGGEVIDINLDFSGLNDIARLDLLSKAENNKVLRDATRAGAEVLKEEVIARAPERTGSLRKTLWWSLSVAESGERFPQGSYSWR